MTQTTLSSKPLLRVLAGETLSPPPLWLMRQAGRHLSEYMALRAKAENFLNFCYSPDLAVEATLQPIRRYGFDAAILFCDILVIPDALGQQVSFVPGEGPKLNALTTLEAVKTLQMDGLHEHLAPVYETISRLRNELPDPVTLIGFAGAPWTVATYVVEGGGSKDYQNVRGWAYSAPDEFQVLIDLLTEATTSYLLRQVEAGAEVLQIFDSWAGVLPPSQFERWVVAPFQKIVAAVKARYPETPIIGFPRGAGLQYAGFAEKTGVDAVSLDVTVPLEWAAENVQPHCVVQGNLDNLALMAGGSEMDAEIERILDILGRGPLIFNLGHGVLPATPVAHVERLRDLVRRNAA